MSSRGTIALNSIWAMLKVCAPGYRAEKKTHQWWVYFRDERETLPLGRHGSRHNPETEIGHVRRLARRFGIIDCMKKQLPQML